MNRLRSIIAVGMSLWLLLSGGAAFALVALEGEHEHEHEHMASPLAAHDARDHQHADGLIDLVSEFFAHPGFDQLTSSSIAAHCGVLLPHPSRMAPVQTAARSLSITPVPPPGPPPRAIAVNPGGGFAS